ncbi:MAG: MerR family transcriptional regulator [Coprobacillus sp.]
MRIKDVELKTGLSAKAIRFYEGKGLIEISRNHSDYREYSEDDIEKLLRIKLLRKCGLSIQELIDIEKGNQKLDDILYERIEVFNKEELDRNDCKNLCVDVLKAKGDYQKLYDTVELLDSDEYQEFIESLAENELPSLSRQIFLTIVGMGPILSSLLFLEMKQYDRLWIGLLLSTVMTICLTLSWRSFITKYKFQKETLKQGIIHFLKMFLIFIILLVILFGSMFGIMFLQNLVFMQDTTYILTQSRWTTLGFLLLGFEILLLFLGFISRFMKHKDFKDYEWLFSRLVKHKWKLIVCSTLIGLFCFTNVTAVHNEGIIKYSLFNIGGTHYNFDEVQQVKTGFHGNQIPYVQSKGDFYYYLIMDDGNKLVFVDCQTTSQYEEQTYSELVELDNQVMKYKPEKISNSDYFQYAMLDQEYIDRFISIINHK